MVGLISYFIHSSCIYIYIYLIRCFSVKYRRIFLRVVLYFDEPAGRVKIQTMHENIWCYFTPKQNSGQRSDRSRIDCPEDLRRLTKISEFFRRPLRITRRQTDKNKIKNNIGVLWIDKDLILNISIQLLKLL